MFVCVGVLWLSRVDFEGFLILVRLESVCSSFHDNLVHASFLRKWPSDTSIHHNLKSQIYQVASVSGEDITYYSDTNKNWVFIAFQTQLKHQCLEILSGKRIVLKTKIFYKKRVSKYNMNIIRMWFVTKELFHKSLLTNFIRFLFLLSV